MDGYTFSVWFLLLCALVDYPASLTLVFNVINTSSIGHWYVPHAIGGWHYGNG